MRTKRPSTDREDEEGVGDNASLVVSPNGVGAEQPLLAVVDERATLPLSGLAEVDHGLDRAQTPGRPTLCSPAIPRQRSAWITIASRRLT
jgi:hypothetical protein